MAVTRRPARRHYPHPRRGDINRADRADATTCSVTEPGQVPVSVVCDPDDERTACPLSTLQRWASRSPAPPTSSTHRNDATIFTEA